jgi:hypothetical protein
MAEKKITPQAPTGTAKAEDDSKAAARVTMKKLSHKKVSRKKVSRKKMSK